MSWDVTIFQMPDVIKTLNDFAYDYIPPVIGTAEEVIRRLTNILPEWNFTGKHGIFTGVDHLVDIDLVSISNDDRISLLSAHIRGGNGALQTLRIIWNHFQCGAIDDGTGERIDTSENPNRGFELWKGYRDQVSGNSNDP